MPAPKHIFISYAHRDANALAARLAADLTASGHEVWYDDKLLGGDRWTNEIEAALDRSTAVLALLSEGSFTSDPCRAEQGWALDAGKRVIPIQVQRAKRAQLRLSHLQAIDFSDPPSYPKSLEKLHQSLGSRAKAIQQPASEPHYNNTPGLPNNYIDRPDLLTRLRNALFLEGPQRNIGLTALQGMGGIGKTVLAQALCHNAAVRCAYPDGIFWFSIGQESKLPFHERIEAVPGLQQLLGSYKGELACISQYRNALRDRAALIVLDDVWSTSDIEPFRIESPRSRLLFTTRDAGIGSAFGARPFTAELFSAEEAREALAKWAGCNPAALPSQATDIIDECKYLALALAMIGAQLKGKPDAHWDIVLGHLHNADLARIKARFPEPHTSLFRAIDVSVNALRREDPEAARRYLALAVLLEDMSTAPAIQQTLWNVGAVEALETSDRFAELSLATHDEASNGIRLHDMQLDYVRTQYPAPEALKLIHGAVRLSAHVIAKDASHFASQMIGRLLPHETDPAIRQFTENVAQGAPRPWIRPLQVALHPPGASLVRTLEGHSDGVSGVDVTTDGKRAVSASDDGTLKMWDLESGRAFLTLEGHSQRVTGVAVTTDGKRAVSASDDNMLKVWDLESGRALVTLKGHSNRVNGVTVTTDGKRAVSASDDGTLKVWDLESGRALVTLKGHSDRINGVAMTTDGKRAVSASDDNMLKVWDLESGRTLMTLEGHSQRVNGVAVMSDGKRAVSASSDNTVKVWDLESGRTLMTLEGHSDRVNGVAVTTDGKRAVSASDDNTLKVWDLESGRTLITLEGHSGWVDGVAVTPNGKRAVSASYDNTLKVWDLESGRALVRLEGYSERVTGVAVTTDGKRAVSASHEGMLVWDLASGRTLEGHSHGINGVAVTADGKRAVSASHNDETLKVWDLKSGRELVTLKGHSNWVTGVAVTTDGKRVVSASADHTLKVWDLKSGRALMTLEGHTDGVTGVAVTTDGKRAVSASHDHTLKVWSLESGRELSTLEGHSNWVNGVAVTTDGKRAVSASHDHTLKVWCLESGRELSTLEGHLERVHGVAVASDGKRAVSASYDKTLKVWDLESAKCIATFHCDHAAQCCAFIDETRFIAGDYGGRLHFLALIQ